MKISKWMGGVAASLALVTMANAVPVINSDNGHMYDIISAQGLTWDAAKQAASGIGSGWSLATITSAAEQNFIFSLIGNSNRGEFWVGGFQTPGTTPSNNNWNWVTGEAFQYTSWALSEPNDYYGPGSEQYLAVWGAGNGDGTAKWNDEGALGNITGYIAEKGGNSTPAAVPEPGSFALFAVGTMALALGLRRRQTT